MSPVSLFLGEIIELVMREVGRLDKHSATVIGINCTTFEEPTRNTIITVDVPLGT